MQPEIVFPSGLSLKNAKRALRNAGAYVYFKLSGGLKTRGRDLRIQEGVVSGRQKYGDDRWHLVLDVWVEE